MITIPHEHVELGKPDQEVRKVEQQEKEVEQEDNLRLFSPVSCSCLILPKLHGCWALLPRAGPQRTPAD